MVYKKPKPNKHAKCNFSADDSKFKRSKTLILLILQKLELSTDSNDSLGSKKDLVMYTEAVTWRLLKK